MGEVIWRSYDQDALNAQLNLRVRTPEHVEFFERWIEESTRYRARAKVQVDLAYGEKAGEKLDFFPGPDRKAPLLAFIHGGYWQSLDKQHYSQFAESFYEAGAAYASLNYTLAPDATIDEMVGELRGAIAWLYEEADDLGFDRERILLAGHSAGGHLATIVAASDWAKEYDLPNDILAGVVSISGLYDLAPIQKSYQQEVVKITDEVLADCSPLRALPKASLPLIVAVGSDEPEEFKDQQADYLLAYRGLGYPALEVDLPGRHHFNAVEALAERDHPLFRHTMKLLMTGELES